MLSCWANLALPPDLCRPALPEPLTPNPRSHARLRHRYLAARAGLPGAARPALGGTRPRSPASSVLPRALAGHVSGGPVGGAGPSNVTAGSLAVYNSDDARPRVQHEGSSTGGGTVQAGLGAETGAQLPGLSSPSATATARSSSAELPPVLPPWSSQADSLDPVEADILCRVAAICAGPQPRGTAG